MTHNTGEHCGACDVWHYWRPSEEAIVELGTVCGRDVRLPMHFHDQDQFTLMLAGKRRFFIRDRLVVTLGTGAWLAGVPHASAGESSGLLCVNVDLPADQYDVAALLRSVELAWTSVPSLAHVSYLLVIGAGVSVALQQVLNADLRTGLGSPLWAALISYLGGPAGLPLDPDRRTRPPPHRGSARQDAMLGSLLFDHVGLHSLPHQMVTPVRLLGAVCLTARIVLIRS